MAGSSRRSLFAVILVIVLCGCLGVVFGQRIGGASASDDSDVRDSLRSFTQVYDVVEKNYAEVVSPDRRSTTAPFRECSACSTPLQLLRSQVLCLLREEQSGKYYGVGMQVGPRNNKVIVIAPFAGAPAYRAAFARATSSSPSTAAHRQYERQRSGRTAERAQGNDGQDFGTARRLR